MKLTPITIVFFVISLFAIWRTLQQLKKDRASLRFSLLWCSMWLVIGVSSIFPGLLNTFTQIAGMKRIFFVLITAIFVLFALVFKLTSELEDLKRKQARIIQELSMLNYKVEGEGQELVDSTKSEA